MGLELCLRVGLGQHFPQSWLWPVLERSQRSWGLPKWCYLKTQLFLQLLGAWGTLGGGMDRTWVCLCHQICLFQRRSHLAWGPSGSPVEGASCSDT